MDCIIKICQVFIFFYSFTLIGQSDNTEKQEVDTIRFQLTEHNNISVQSILNDIDTISLMFHTAVNSVSLTPDQSKKLQENINKKSSNAGTWSGTKEVDYIEQNKLNIAELEWQNIEVWLDMLSGPGTNGKFGKNLFKDKFIEIDFDKEIIVLHTNKSSIYGLAEYGKFDMTIDENHSLYIEGSMLIEDMEFMNKYLIHSGYGGTIILDDQFCKENNLIERLDVIEENELKDSFGNIIKTKKGLANEFQICNKVFTSVPVSYFDSELEIQKTSVLGGEILKRFNMVLDVENKQLYMKPNKYSGVAFRSS